MVMSVSFVIAKGCGGGVGAKVEEKKRKVEVGSRLDEYICNCAKGENL